jgi:hypothetical protein
MAWHGMIEAAIVPQTVFSNLAQTLCRHDGPSPYCMRKRGDRFWEENSNASHLSYVRRTLETEFTSVSHELIHLFMYMSVVRSLARVDYVDSFFQWFRWPSVYGSSNTVGT